jgi:hypothetical protein
MYKVELIVAVVAVAAVAAISSPAAAQGSGRGNAGVPAAQRPPTGLCRIWIDGVPPERQPAPTDCLSAERRRPYNARVIYGDGSGLTGKHAAIANGSIVTIERRACVRRRDRDDNVFYSCPDGVHDSHGVFLPNARIDDRGRVSGAEDPKKAHDKRP